MTRARSAGWTTLGLDLWLLGLESSAVIGMRAMKLAAGGAAADREARLMVSEKLAAATSLSRQAALGALDPSKAVAQYRRRVRSNLRRLRRS